MANQIKQSVFAGFAGTAVMIMIMFIAPFIGMPKMNPAVMLAEMMSLPMASGWITALPGMVFIIQGITNRYCHGNCFNPGRGI